MEVPASTNVPVAASNGGGGAGGGMLATEDLSIYFKGHRVNLVVSPEPSAPPDKADGDLVEDVKRVKDTVGAVEHVVKTVLEDKDAKVSKVNCYKVLSKYALNQVKLRGLEAKVRALEKQLAQQKQQQRPISPSAETPSSSSNSHHILKQAQQDELVRKAEKLETFKATHQAPSSSPTFTTCEAGAGSINSAASVSSHKGGADSAVNQDQSVSDGEDVSKLEREEGITQDYDNDDGVGVEEELSETSREISGNADGEKNNGNDEEDDEGSSYFSAGGQSFIGDASMAYTTRSEARSTYALQLRDSEIQRAVGNIVIKKHDPSLDSPKESYLPTNSQGSYEKNGAYSGSSVEAGRAPVVDASNSKSCHDNFGRVNESWEDERNANVREDSDSSYESDYDSLPPAAAPRVEATGYDSDKDDGDGDGDGPSFQAQEEKEKEAISEPPPQESRPVEAEAPKKVRRQRKGSIGMITAPFSVVANAGASVANAGASVANAGASAVMKQALNARNYVMPASMGGGGPAGPSSGLPRGRRQRKGSIASGIGNMAVGMKNYVMPASWDGEKPGPALDSPAAEDVRQAQSAEPPQEKKLNKKKKALRVLALPVAVVAAPVAVAASPVALIVWQAKKKKKAKRLKKAAASAEGENAGAKQMAAKLSEKANKGGALPTSKVAPPKTCPEPRDDIPAVQLSDVEGVQAFDPAETLFVASLPDAREEPVVGDVEEKKEKEKPEPKLGEFETGELRALELMGIATKPRPKPALPVEVNATPTNNKSKRYVPLPHVN